MYYYLCEHCFIQGRLRQCKCLGHINIFDTEVTFAESRMVMTKTNVG